MSHRITVRELRPIEPVPVTAKQSGFSTLHRIAFAEFPCPGCGADCSTDDAMVTEQITGGVRFLGVLCRGGCGKSYTVELTEAPEAAGNVTQVPEPDKMP